MAPKAKFKANDLASIYKTGNLYLKIRQRSYYKFIKKDFKRESYLEPKFESTCCKIENEHTITPS